MYFDLLLCTIADSKEERLKKLDELNEYILKENTQCFYKAKETIEKELTF